MLAFVLLLERLFTVVKRRKKNTWTTCVKFLQKKQTIFIMLRRSAVTFAERALASSSRTRTSKLATTAQKRGMGAFFFYLFTLLSSALSSRERVEGKSIVWFWFSSFCAYYALPCDWRRLLSLSLSNALLSDESFVLCSAGGEGGVTHEGLTIHPAAPVHKILGTAMGGLMWFWVMYRFYHDGETLIYGHEPHFLHDDHHDDDEDGHKKHW